MEQLGTDFNATGSVMSRAELEEQRRKRGECVTCGRKCFQKKIFKMIPITDHGRVLNGRCLNCHPLDVNDGALPAVSRPATKADLARFTRSQNNLRQSIVVAPSGSSSQPEEQRPSSQRRTTQGDHVHRSSSRSGGRRSASSGVNRSQSRSSRSLRNQPSDGLSVTSEGAQRAPTASRSMDNVRGQDASTTPSTRPSFTRPNSSRSVSAGSYYSAHSRGSSAVSHGSVRSSSHQRQAYGMEQDDTTDGYDEYDDHGQHQQYGQGLSSTEHALLEAQEFARQFADESESGGGDDPIPLLRADSIPPTHASALAYYNQRSSHGADRATSVRSIQSNGSAISRDNSMDRNYEHRPLSNVQRRLSEVSLSARSFERRPSGQSLQSSERRSSAESLSARSYDAGMHRSHHCGGTGASSGIVYQSFDSERSLDSNASFGEEAEHIEYQVQVPQNLSTNEIALTNSNEEVGSYASSRSSGDPEKHPGDASNHSRAAAGSPGGSGRDSGHMQHLRDAGNNVVDILNCMRDYPDYPDVQAIGLRTISDLDLSEEDSAMLANIGAIQVVAGAMERYHDDLDLQIYGCRTIWNISGSPENQRVLVEGGALDVLQRTMAHHVFNTDLQEQALAVVANIAAVEDNLGPLLDAGAVERLVEAMNKHAGNADVQVKGCLALANLASHSSAPKQQLVEAGGGSAVVISMVMHPSNPELQEKALRALRNLSANCDHNRIELTNIGGIDAIISAMQVHRDDAAVQEVGSWTLSNLAGNADSRVLIGDCGGIDVVVRAMWVHAGKVAVQEWCGRALYALAIDQHNAKMILDVGGISAIVNSMQAHTDSAAIQETGCAVLCGLAFDQPSKIRIVDEEALDAVVLAMVLHGDDAAVNERACRLLLQLSIAENFKAMQASNVGELVRSAAHKFPENCGEPAEELIHVIEGFISDYL